MKTKTRINNHLHTFINKQLKNAICLSKAIWKLEEYRRAFKVKWGIIAKSQPYKLGDSECRLCITEILEILKFKFELINERIEVNGNCQHKAPLSFLNHKYKM